MLKTVLVVDDSAAMRKVVSVALRGGGYEVVEACDGNDALAKMDGRKLHLIICDVNMPNLDGISFVKEAKKLPDYRFTPVVMLTTDAHEDTKHQSQAAGAKAWLIKPFQAAQLLAVVARLVLP